MDGKRAKAKKRRQRFKQEAPLSDRLLKLAANARHEAARLPLGSQRDHLLRKAKQAEVVASLDQWLSLPRKQAPQAHSEGRASTTATGSFYNRAAASESPRAPFCAAGLKRV
jgi:hypothetical protein